jgi:ubiquinone/menaquinone biosynthesis C-methylase UbiE
MTVEAIVAKHYTHGSLEQAIDAMLKAAGNDPARLSAEDLAPVDEFHIGGKQATLELAAQIGLRPGLHLVDVGSGIGGPARTIALAHDCRVTGVDLTEEYVAVATSLSRRVGLGERATFKQASATSLPFGARHFDGATMIHVGMNIAEKAKVFAEVARVLKPGGFFAVYDIMRTKDGPITYPVPWAVDQTSSFVEPSAAYRRYFEAAGFKVGHERGRRAFALEYFEKLRARAGQGTPSTISLMPDFANKVANMQANLREGLIEPTEMIGRLRA